MFYKIPTSTNRNGYGYGFSAPSWYELPFSGLSNEEARLNSSEKCVRWFNKIHVIVTGKGN